MTGYGLFIRNCGNVTITNCSYYHSATCNFTLQLGGGVGISYEVSNTGYTLELSHSNMTKCCSYGFGGGISLGTKSGFGSARLLFSHLVLLQNNASKGGGGLAYPFADGNANFVIAH